MGTNFCFRHDFRYGEIYEIHIAKISGGWLPLFESHRSINSVKDIKAAYDTGQFEIVDEYGKKYSWEQFEERVLNWNKDNPKALSHILPPKDFTKEQVIQYYGTRYESSMFFTDDEGYEFCNREFE
jgi:hypothetical protein